MSPIFVNILFIVFFGAKRREINNYDLTPKTPLPKIEVMAQV